MANVQYKTVKYIDEEGEEQEAQYLDNGELIISNNATSRDIAKIEKILGWKNQFENEDKLVRDLYARSGINLKVDETCNSEPSS